MSFQVLSSPPLELGAGTLKNVGDQTVYYRDELPVSSTTNDGSLAAGASVTVTGSTWVVTASGATSACTFAPAVASSETAQSGHVVEDEGTPLGARSKLNFTGAGVTATDNPGADSTDISISGAGVSDASTTVKGVTKLATAPVSASAPIAVGDNDPRVTADQAAGTASIRTLGTGAAQAAAGNHTHTKTDVGLGNVDNTSDASKPVSTAQAAADALALGKASNLSDLANAGTARTNLGLGTVATTALDVDGTLAANSDVKVPSQKAIRTYVAANAGGATVTKRVTAPLNGAGTTGSLAAFTSFTHRWPIVLPVTTTRWRLRVRNRDSIGGAAETGAISFTGAWVGTPAFSGTGAWDGTCTAALTSALTAFATASDGSEFTSSWVSDPTLQFAARVPAALSVGATLSAATAVVRSNTGQILRYSVDATDAAAQAGSASLSVGSATTATGICDIRLEYEFSTPAVSGQAVVLGIGDSLLERVVGAGSTAFPHQAWIGAAGLRAGFAWINLGVGGALSADFVAGTDWRWARADLTTTVPDAAIIALGYNDASNGVTLATYKTNLNSVIANVRALGVKNIWLATTIPGNLDGTADPLRVSYNDYVRTLPLGVVGCVDHDLVMRDPTDVSSPFTPLASLSSTPPHPLLGGYQAMGAVAGIIGR